MRYLLFPYTVGCIYEGCSTDYIRVVTEDAEEYCIRWFCAACEYADKLNAARAPAEDFMFEGEEFPINEFFSYDSDTGLWEANEPYYMEMPRVDGLETFVVEYTVGDDITYSLSEYEFVFAKTKEEVKAALKAAYEAFRTQPELKVFDVCGTDFRSYDVLRYVEVSVSKYKKEMEPYYNIDEVYTDKEFLQTTCV